MLLNQLTQHSSHLWISDSATVEQQIITALQKDLCKAKGCLTCSTCTQIIQKTHPWITWLQPDGSYLIEQIDQVIESVQFMLDTNEKRFFIFTQAHELTSTCCNRLLKTIEEPHAGYHFVFMTHRPQELLPTLKSRCFVQMFQSQPTNHAYHEIMQPFIEMSLKNPIQCMKLIDKLQIKESCTKEIVDLLIEHFYTKLKTSVQSADTKSQKIYLDIMIVLKKSLLQLPIQGSHKLFWKNLYITFHQQTTSCIKE